MSTSQSLFQRPSPPLFPTRGVSGGWHDPWDTDPREGLVSGLRQRNALRRQVSEAGVHLDLVAEARTDGRWEAHVTSSDGDPKHWPSTNGPTASVALDALEAELRELLGISGIAPDSQD